MRLGWLRGTASFYTLTVVLVLGIAGMSIAQPRPQGDNSWTGQWRGVIPLPNGGPASVILAIQEADGVYSGYVSGFETGVTVRLGSISIEGSNLIAEATGESDFGRISVHYALTQDQQSLNGVQRYVLGPQTIEVPVELKRAFRPEVPQPQVEQHLAYFLGEWELEYTGAEFPPLSLGMRSGRVTFTQAGDAPFLHGHVTGELFGEAYEESVIIGYDESSEVLLFKETLSNSTELLSLGNWQSPIAINLVTHPIEVDGHVHQLRRVISVTSENAFTVTDEFSVDGAPFRRLGNGSFLRVR